MNWSIIGFIVLIWLIIIAFGVMIYFEYIDPLRRQAQWRRERKASKEMNNKPVSKYKAITNTKIEPTVVSYTHPAELTDEEKLQFGMLFMNWNRSLKEPLVKPAYEQYVFEQAIAILRKAQEK